MHSRVDVLRDRISALEAELVVLKEELSALESQTLSAGNKNLPSEDHPKSSSHYDRPLSLEEYARYGRQMIVSDVGLEGKIRYYAF